MSIGTATVPRMYVAPCASSWQRATEQEARGARHAVDGPACAYAAALPQDHGLEAHQAHRAEPPRARLRRR